MWGLILGKLAAVVARIWFTSINPMWWTNYHNSFFITLVLLATLEKIVSGYPRVTSKATDHSGEKDLCLTYNIMIFAGHDALPGMSVDHGIRSSSVLTGAGLGSLMYLTHAVFGEVSVVTRWSVGPYPNTGPMPWPWG